MSRAIRSTSHVDLLEEERTRLRSEGKDPSLARINIRVYKHAAVLASGESTVDIEMWLASEDKDKNIKRMERILKQCAIDCQIHRARNIRPTDTPGTPACDYMECDYKCASEVPKALDTTTYDVYYSGDVISAIIAEVSLLFKLYTAIPLAQLYATYEGKYRPKFIDMALEKLITSKTQVLDRFGFPSYLQIDSDMAFLQRDYPLMNSQ